MKIRDLFNYVHKLKEDPFKDGELLMWLNEVEGLVHTKVFLLAPSEYKEITADDIDSDTFKLLIVGPHQKIYPAYLMAMIDFANGEYNRYANTLEMFNAHFTELQMWHRQYAAPADGECEFRGYYLSAYAIAVNHGFGGSEEEWLDSLKGDKGDSAYESAVKLGYKGTEQEWIAYLEKAQTDAIDAALESALKELSDQSSTSQGLINSAREEALQIIADANNSLHSSVDEHHRYISSELGFVRDESINAINEAKNGAIDEIGLAAGIVQTTGNDATKVMSQKASSNTFANALKGTASGEAIAITDASPVEHTMDVRVKSKNILPYPFLSAKSLTTQGITFTPNEDRSITISGVATGNAYYLLWNANLGSRNMVGSASGGTNGDYAFSPFVNYSASNKNVSLYVANGTDLSTPVTVYPQIEKGPTATAYTPYIEDISTVKVKKRGKNLFKGTTRKEHKGITFEPLDDGTYHVYGTNDGTGNSYLDHFLMLPAGKYTGSGCPQGGSNTTYHVEFYNQATNSGSKDYGNGAVFEATATQRFTVQMAVKSGQTVDLIFKPMIEVGTGDKVYAPYIEPIEYPVSADGTVEGVTPIYPTTTLMTDTAGAVIDCIYNRDINKAFEELYSAIISTGGNV